MTGAGEKVVLHTVTNASVCVCVCVRVCVGRRGCVQQDCVLNVLPEIVYDILNSGMGCQLVYLVRGALATLLCRKVCGIRPFVEGCGVLLFVHGLPLCACVRVFVLGHGEACNKTVC